MTVDQFEKKLEIEEVMLGMKIVILTKLHLNESGKKKDVQELNYCDFKRCLISMMDFNESSIILYFDERGVFCIKSRYTNYDTNKYLGHLGIFDYKH